MTTINKETKETKQSKETKKIFILIDKQLEKVKQGGDASCLASLINQYEFSTIRNEQLTPIMVSHYYSALFLSHRFIELMCVALRNMDPVRIPQSQDFYLAANQARDQEFKSLIQTAKKLALVAQSQLRNHFVKSAKRYILLTLGRDYINIDANYLKKNYQIQKEDIEECGQSLEGNYAYLNVKKENSDINNLMLTRIRQLSEVTKNVIRSVQ